MICETSVASGAHSRTYLKNSLADQRTQRSNFMRCKLLPYSRILFVLEYLSTRNVDRILAVRKYPQIGRRYGRARPIAIDLYILVAAVSLQPYMYRTVKRKGE